MKNLLLIALPLLLAGGVRAQDDRLEKKRFNTGFNIGINKANVITSSNSPDMAIQNGMGFRMGLISSFAFTKRFSVEPKLELSLNAANVSFENEEYRVNPADLEMILHFRRKFFKGGFSPYIIAGPNVKVPLPGRYAMILPTRQDVAIDVGVGLDVPFGKKIRVAPELRYSFGLLNISESSTVNDLKFHNVALVLNIGGRPRL